MSLVPYVCKYLECIQAKNILKHLLFVIGTTTFLGKIQFDKIIKIYYEV